MKKYLKILSPVLSGILISIGGCVNLMCDVKIVGAILFSIGLYTIVNYSLDLFTGKICYCIYKEYNGLNPIIIWIFNFIGTIIMAGLLSYTRLSPTLIEKASNLCKAKLNDSYISLFILGMFCNFMIFLAVDGFKNAKSDLGKTIFVFMGVIVFIMSGFEHSIADMFYFSMAHMLSVKSIICLLVITLGNSIGGILINYLFRSLKQ
ncbi:MAG: formate/nitrite transporter family protein [Lachnospiraceae bacterium]|nr:formate/nitrite transporter family protein [Lachnospiraceae bacterium]